MFSVENQVKAFDEYVRPLRTLGASGHKVSLAVMIFNLPHCPFQDKSNSSKGRLRRTRFDLACLRWRKRSNDRSDHIEHGRSQRQKNLVLLPMRFPIAIPGKQAYH
jgi:hypothetical protein